MAIARGYGKRTNKGSLVVMFAAFTLLALYLADTLPILRLSLIHISANSFFKKLEKALDILIWFHL